MNLGARITGRRRTLLMAVSGLVAISLVQEYARFPTEDLTSSGTWGIAVAWSVPILLAALGGMFSERSGIVNIGLEGMMILGTWSGAMFTLLGGPWWGLLGAGVVGLLGGVVMAVATVTFKVDQIIAGVALNLMAPGIARYLSDIHFSDRGGSITQSPTVSGGSSFSMPFLAGGYGTPDLLGKVERFDLLVLSDLAGILRGPASGMAWMTLVLLMVVPVAGWVLWRTAFGLRLRSAGEHPDAADSLGVSVYLYRYFGVMISGFLAGTAGGFLAIELSGLYKEGQTQGKGYIGLATMIFGNWRPVGAALGALLFGFTETLRLRDPDAPHALLLLAALGLLVLAVRSARNKRWVAVGITAALGLLVGRYYLVSSGVPDQLPKITPYLTVLVVLLFGTRKLRPPAAEGRPWSKGEH